MLLCVIGKIVLDDDEGSALITRTGGQVTQGTEQVSVLPGGCPLGTHVAHQISTFGANLFADGILECFARQVGKVVVGQELQFQFVGFPGETGRVGGGDHGVRQFPDAAHRVLEGAVAIDHGFHMQTPFFFDAGLDAVHDGLAVSGEEF